MTWNGFSDGIAVDTSKFRMLCWYSNTIYAKNSICVWQRLMYVILVRDWKKVKPGGQTICEEVSNISRELTESKDRILA